ncbi:T9SS C-terminal target domain-containing protein [Aquimarina sp. AD1]|uniref:esterase-like activity of phytase family protein n=1 Tax=Aquimarina sp. (strain AD1) TaxID=1714848 RepID=UPI000E4C7B62|nr:esterase-like activity of phytase family protein [Aquimarina sp. AD1]AXT54910.1 T9SS C-terminal target domain-containing protein [Aquimarina sp. AD1]RKN18544.1 T9SS C-terminal target domain-containing protein [Aquimarina sp. AD1]
MKNYLYSMSNRHRKSICISACLGFLISFSAFAQTEKDKSTPQFDLPNDNYYGQEIYAKGKGKSFRNFGDLLFSRAVLDAASFSEGPTSGLLIGNGPINEQNLPFDNKQPIQGFSAVLNNMDGTFTAMSDNGFGSIENSADYNLRLYKIKPRFETFFRRGEGDIQVLEYTELKDPNGLIPFAITNHFSQDRVLTGADFDIESIQRTTNGDYWIGDEFGPFLLHFDQNGVLIDAPYPLPDLDNEGKELRSPQNPFSEEASAIRIMNAMRAHAQVNGSKAPVMSPWFVMLDDNDETTVVGSRMTTANGLVEASSELFNVSSLNRAGHPVVVYTVNDTENMNRLLDLDLQGIISDRPDLLLEAVQNFDKNQDGRADYMDDNGLIDVTLFDAQGHRGARNLRPENTIPSMEAALDYLMPTLETDCGITLDGIPVLDHDPHIEAAKTRKVDGTPYEYEDEVLVKNLTLDSIQKTFIADKILAGRPAQTNDLSLSPVAVAFANEKGFIDPYVMPSLQQLFDFVAFYEDYYKNGEGSSHPEATKRWMNASKVRFNIETKINPRTDLDDRGDVFSERTFGPETFTKAIADIIVANELTDRADIQSFDFRTLLLSQEQYPEIRTVCLFGDFPKVGDAGDGTNLQDQNGENTPWLAGMYWPYRVTKLDTPFNVKQSGGFEGMALTTDNTTLLPLLEKSLEGSENNNLLIHEFNLASKSYTNKKYEYPLNERASAIGDFVMFSRQRGLIIERDGSQGDLEGFKAIYEIELDEDSTMVQKRLNVDLLNIRDPRRISEPGLPGDIGIGREFAFPFVTIESVVVLNPFLIGVLNDNNYPFSVGRHVGEGLPDDNEFILLWLDQRLGLPWYNKKDTVLRFKEDDFKTYPNTFTNKVTFSSINEKISVVSIDIFDLAGNLVKQINSTKTNENGFEYIWDGKADSGADVSTGIYIAIIQADGEFIKKKLVKK